MRMSERREKIKMMLQAQPFVALSELEVEFPDVSSMTLRRDIEFFELKGDAIKVRGGARSMKFITTSMEDSFTKRLSENTGVKEKLALCAADLIGTGRSLFIDSGTTTLALAAYIPDERFIITTTGPNIALELARKHKPIINLVGGMLNRDNVSISGNQALAFLQDINIDVAFVVPSGISAETGLTSGNYAECEIKKLVVQKAHRVVVLLDTSKDGKILPYTFCSLEDADTIICDRSLTGELAETASESGVEIIIA